MSKGEWIKPEVRKYFTRRALDERKAIKEGKLTLDKLVKRVTDELKNDKKTPPKPSTLKREMSKVINREPSPEDQPWHMGTWKDYPLTVPGLAAVLQAYRFAAFNKATLTIRQAKWISRLSAYPRRLFPTGPPNGPSDKELTVLLIIWACRYAQEEMECEVFEIPFDPTGLDLWLAVANHTPRDKDEDPSKEHIWKADGEPRWREQAAVSLSHDPRLSRKILKNPALKFLREAELAQGDLGHLMRLVAVQVQLNPELVDEGVFEMLGALDAEVGRLMRRNKALVKRLKTLGGAAAEEEFKKTMRKESKRKNPKGEAL